MACIVKILTPERFLKIYSEFPSSFVFNRLLNSGYDGYFKQQIAFAYSFYLPRRM
jgi:hypothetical protein